MGENTYQINSTIASMAFTLAQEWDPLHIFPTNPLDHSNEWVVSGNKTVTGKPILVGGPVLAFTLPSIWFQVQITDPEFNVYGVVLPGAPVIVIGYNNYIGWTLTDTQAISWGTFFFVQHIEKDKYLWNNTYFNLKHYKINGINVNWTNLGPVMIQNGSNALVMDWMGNMFSNDLGALLNVMKSSNWEQFKTSLEIWNAPFQNFAFADINGTIADISPGYYPTFGSVNKIPYNPGAIMPGDGTQFINGSIPYDMVPQVVNPKIGYIVSSNQRQVGPSYPYWFGNTMSPSPGYRAMLEENYLSTHNNITISDMMNLQSNNYTDVEASIILPYLIKYISNSTNNNLKFAYNLLSTWNYSMSTNSKAATIWFFTYMYLFKDIFVNLFKRYGILPEYQSILNISGMGGSFPSTIGIPSFDLDMAKIFLTGNVSLYSSSSLESLVINATEQAMVYLYSMYPDGNFTWGHFYGFEFPSILGIPELGVGPLSRGGDYNTPNDASGVGPYNYPSGGQSWIMILNFANLSDSYGVYPGGQSENPASPLYSNYINYWINGEYLKLLFYDSAKNFSIKDIRAIITLEG